MEDGGLEDRAEHDTLLHDANLAQTRLAPELAVLVYAKERAHSKADKVIGRIGHRVFAFASEA
jgi:hypothetical protein